VCACVCVHVVCVMCVTEDRDYSKTVQMSSELPDRKLETMKVSGLSFI